MKQGQIAVTDLFIAIAIFVALIISITLLWATYDKRVDERVDYNTMQMKALQITDLLTKTPGIPNGWEKNPENVVVIGLAYIDRNISTDKADAFIALDYDIIRDLFKIKSYNFYFEIKGTTVAKGNKPANEKKAVSLKNNIIYAGQNEVLNFILWV